LVPFARLAARVGLTVVTGLLAVGALGLSAPAGAQSTPSGVIAMTSQDPWVTSSSVPVQLGLSVHSPIAAKDLLVHVALYTEPDQSSLASRDEFDATLKGQLAGLNELTPITLSLDSIRNGHGLVDLFVGGSELSGRIPAKTPTDRVFQLPCPARYGGCGGVYPMQVSLQDISTGLSLDSFTTYLIVVPSKVPPQRRLRFSFVVPVGASIALNPAGAPAVPPKTTAQIDDLAREEALSPGVPLTVDLYGQTLLALARSQQHLKLVSTVAYGGLDNLVAGPFSNIDPTRLVRAGLQNDLTGQFLRDGAVFTRVLHLSGTSHVYVATVPVGPRGLATLASEGITEIVLPQDNLESLPGNQPSTVEWPYTLSAPFQIAGSTVEGLQGDPDLAAHLDGTSNPVLRAQQLLADLAEIYFDSPGYPLARGVALVAPESWVPQVKFLGAVMRGLGSSPVAKTVPITQLFATVKPGICQVPPVVVSGCSAAVRALSSPPTDSGSVTLHQVQSARTALAELTSVIPNDSATLHALADAVLLAETDGLSSAVRQSYLAAPLDTMRTLGSRLGLPAGRTVTVTSSSARFPIAITSSSKSPVHAVLVISGPDLTASRILDVVLRHGTTSFIVRVRTRTSGDSSLQLQLLSPDGRVELARVELTIRSTAISSVAIALSLGAVAFLLFWWLRSASRRRRRKAKHLSDQQRKPSPEVVQEPAP